MVDPKRTTYHINPTTPLALYHERFIAVLLPGTKAAFVIANGSGVKRPTPSRRGEGTRSNLNGNRRNNAASLKNSFCSIEFFLFYFCVYDVNLFILLLPVSFLSAQRLHLCITIHYCTPAKLCKRHRWNIVSHCSVDRTRDVYSVRHKYTRVYDCTVLTSRRHRET
jgi:hypothetical protein